jgi:hypothetical protein
MRGRGDNMWPERDLWFLSFQKGGGRLLCFFFFLKDEKGARLLLREDRVRRFSCVFPPFFCSLNCPLCAYGWRFIYIKIYTRAIQGNIAIIIAEIVFYNQHQQFL